MAKPTSKKTTPQSETKVTRIKASEPVAIATKTPAKPKTATKKATKEKTSKATPATVEQSPKKRRNPLRAIKEYVAGAWYELRQVRWPDRKATWSMTGALILFTAFFVVIILLLDMLFKYIFQMIIT